MTRKVVFSSALALAAIAVPGALAAPKPDQQLSIGTSAAAVKFGADLTVSGDLTGGTARDISGQKITLQADEFPYEGNFDRVTTVETNDAGHYGFTLKPKVNAKYRTTAKGCARSPDVIALVRAVVALTVSDKTPEKGERVMFSGTVRPAHDAKVVRIQRRTKDGWKNISKTTLIDGGDAFSTYSKKVRINKSGRYRARFRPGDGDHAPGNSAAVRIKTH